MGKATISTGPFSIAMLNYQRVTFTSVMIVMFMNVCDMFVFFHIKNSTNDKLINPTHLPDDNGMVVIRLNPGNHYYCYPSYC